MEIIIAIVAAIIFGGLYILYDLYLTNTTSEQKGGSTVANHKKSQSGWKWLGGFLLIALLFIGVAYWIRTAKAHSHPWYNPWGWQWHLHFSATPSFGIVVLVFLILLIIFVRSWKGFFILLGCSIVAMIIVVCVPWRNLGDANETTMMKTGTTTKRAFTEDEKMLSFEGKGGTINLVQGDLPPVGRYVISDMRVDGKVIDVKTVKGSRKNNKTGEETRFGPGTPYILGTTSALPFRWTMFTKEWQSYSVIFDDYDDSVSIVMSYLDDK